jgi:hypothetical protein
MHELSACVPSAETRESPAVMQRDNARFFFDGQAKWFFLFAGPGAVAS